MKNWNVPEINELDVKLTASGGGPSTVEQVAGGGVGNWSILATYDSALYESDGTNEKPCINPIKSSVES